MSHFAHTKIDHNRYPPSQPPPHGRELLSDSSLVDGSWRLDNMYLGVAKDEDRVMAESWQADAEGMLLFVSLYSHFTLYAFGVNSNIVDRLVLRCRRGIPCGVYTGSTAGLSQAIEFILPALHTKARCCDYHALEFELVYQPYLCTSCDIAATVGTPICQDHS